MHTLLRQQLDRRRSQANFALETVKHMGHPPQEPSPDSSPRILLVQRGEFSGINRSISDALRRAGCDVRVVTLSLRALPIRPLVLVLMFIHAAMLYGRRYDRYLNRTPAAAWAASLAGKRLLREFSTVDAVLCSGGASFALPKDRSRAVKYALIADHFNFLSKQLADRGVDIPEKRVHRSWDRIERRATESYDHVFVLGRHVRDAAIREWSLQPTRITAIGAGPNHDLDIERDRVGKCYSSRRILFVGKDSSRKGIADVLEAFSRIRESFPDALLHVVGDAVKERAGVVSHGRLNGNELRELFYDSQILVLPSYREPFGIALLEGMWSKCVCIGTSIGEMPDIIDDGRNGYLIDPGDRATLVDRISKLLADPLLLETMAEESYKVATRGWHWDYAAQQILNVMFRPDEEDPDGSPTAQKGECPNVP